MYINRSGENNFITYLIQLIGWTRPVKIDD